MKILAGLVVGAVAGIVSNLFWSDAPVLIWIVAHVAQPAGQIFLRMLFMVVVPLVFTSLVLGVTGLGDLTRLGRISIRTLGLFLATTIAAGMVTAFSTSSEGIALVLGIDRLLDMARTVPNVTGDLVASVVIDRWERGPVTSGIPDERGP